MPYHQQNHTLQHDSYNCLMRTHKGSKPFPTKRVDGLYCGWGPFKFNERRKIFITRCPKECRPPANQSWVFC
ncbi:hypothetical protein Pcinc_007779 [Petrolisthes cinctipes]|uniref:Uncharacterized protein n=1 Tax=Petrolisthes cinctipes TaxID=88211 RepID=A0AAE1G7U9_PETCI|nr:hypothetical protein Pcinc_007779 [Petrolisthes cinctipes]